MRLFLGILIGLVLAIGVAAGAAYMAFGDLGDVGERDRGADVSQTYDMTDFDRISVGGVYELNVRVGEDYSIKVSGAPEEMARIKIGVENGELRLDQSNRSRIRGHWRNQGLTADITMPALQAVNVSGVVEADITGVESDIFSVRLSGVGEINVAGACGALSAAVSGVGDLDAADLHCANVDVRVSGVGEASVYASQSVDASVSGIGSINVSGSPAEVTKSKSFLADISVK